ncbi:MAG: GNAT family N-acetyltransferase [Bacillota bacterium]
MTNTVRIRPAGMRDVDDLYRIRIAPGAAAETLAVPSISPEEFRAGHGRALENHDNHMLVAELGGEVVGCVNLTVNRGRRAHSATLGIAVRDDHWGRGIGKQLLSAALDLADLWLALHRVELEVYADNARAIALYFGLGFTAEGIKRSAAVRDGRYVDILVMGRLRQDEGASG